MRQSTGAAFCTMLRCDDCCCLVHRASAPDDAHARPRRRRGCARARRALVDEGRHDEAVEQLESLWPEVRGEAPSRSASASPSRGARCTAASLDSAAELLAHAETIARSPRFDAADRAELLYRRGCVAFKQGEVADATSLFTRALDLNEHAPRQRRAARRERVRVAVALLPVRPRLGRRVARHRTLARDRDARRRRARAGTRALPGVRDRGAPQDVARGAATTPSTRSSSTASTATCSRPRES